MLQNTVSSLAWILDELFFTDFGVADHERIIQFALWKSEKYVDIYYWAFIQLNK